MPDKEVARDMVELSLERRIPAAAASNRGPLADDATSRSISIAGALGNAFKAAWHAVRKVLGLESPERTRQLVEDAVLIRILVDRGHITRTQAASAVAERDHSGLLLQHVLHARHGVPMGVLLTALAERRAVIRDS